MGGWWAGGPGLVLVAAIAIGSLVTLWRAMRPHSAGSPAATLPGQRLIGWAITVGVLYAALVGIGTVFTAIGIGRGEGAVTLLTEPYWPRLPSDVGGLIEVDSGGYTSALVTVSGIGIAARVWYIVGLLFSSAIHIGIAVVVVRICQRLRNGDGILGSSRQFTTLALVVLIGGLGAQIATGLGSHYAATDIIPFGLGEAVPEADWPVPQRVLQIDLWPVFPALAIAALAAAFRHGERLQRDTEGLV